MEDDDLCFLFEIVEPFIDLDSMMLIGARARDVHQLKYRDTPPVRTTNDVDLALAISRWEPLEALRKSFPATTDEWQKLQVGPFPVDVVPFGGIENPPGEVSVGDGFLMNVAGFSEAFGSCEFHTLSNGTTIKLASVAGLAALKLCALFEM